MARSRSLRSQGQPVLALQAATQATQVRPQQAETWVCKSAAELALRNDTQAARDAEHALSLEPAVDAVLSPEQRAAIARHRERLRGEADG